MPKKLDGAILDAIQVDRNLPALLHQQIFGGIRELILTGSLGSGTRLPSTRVLMHELDVSRNTVRQAYDQLMAEGYIYGQDGAGTFVAADIPDAPLPPVDQSTSPSIAGKPPQYSLSKRGRRIANVHVTQGYSEARPFASSLPALDQFPVKLWGRIVARQWNRADLKRIGYGELAGYEPLRKAVASYLRITRGVSCDWEQVIVVSGSQQAFDIVMKILLDPGDSAWIEDPGFQGIRNILTSTGVRPIPIPVDEFGLNVDAGQKRAADARVAVVGPSHQYPLGVTMPLSRRLELLRWAYQTSGWIIEDDYDSEFRYSGRPIPALQGIDRHERVIYVGTFGKVLSPSLRIGYMVVPTNLIAPVTKAIGIRGRGLSTHLQSAMAEFITEGHLATHIRRMRKTCGERQQTLLDAVHRECDGLLEISPTHTGLHVVGWLPDDIDDVVAYEAAMQQGIETYPISKYYSSSQKQRGGLMLGFASAPLDEIVTGVRVLAEVLSKVRGSGC